MPPSINMAYLEIRLSGGASNTDPNVSLGGIMSSERVLSQSIAALTNVTGVTPDYAAGNALGDGTLSFINATTSLTWAPDGGTAGDPVDVSTDGKYILSDNTSNAQLLATVTSASLPSGDVSDTDVTIANISNETFDNITKQESLDGDIEYRCFYITNTHPTDQAFNVTAWINSDTIGADSLKIAADLAGVGDGSTTGVADTVASEGEAPSPSIAFSAPTTQETGLNLGTLNSGQSVAYWEQRTVPAENTLSEALNVSQLGFSAYL